MKQSDQFNTIFKPGAFWGVLGLPRTGKAQPVYSKILTPHGFVEMGKLSPGDLVIGSDGKHKKVTGVFPQGEKPVYRVTLSDGSHAESTGDHLWTVRPHNMRPRTIPLSEISSTLVRRYYLPLIEPVEFFPASTLFIDPYLLGVLIGDGCITGSNGVGVTISDPLILEEIKKALPDGSSLHYRNRYDWIIKSKTGSRTTTLVEEHTDKHGRLVPSYTKRMRSRFRQELESLGLWGHKAHEKFIPQAYLLAPVGDRISILQGLLDTDGYAAKDQASIVYYTTSPRLADDVKSLVQSLGGTVRTTLKRPFYTYQDERRRGRDCHVLTITIDLGCPPFRGSKKFRCKTRRRYGVRSSRRIVSVEPVGTVPVQCISVDSPDGLYVTDEFILTHNTTVLMLIAQAALAHGWIVFSNVMLQKWDPTKMENVPARIDNYYFAKYWSALFEALPRFVGKVYNQKTKQYGLRNKILFCIDEAMATGFSGGKTLQSSDTRSAIEMASQAAKLGITLVIVAHSDKMLTSQMRVQGLLTGYIRKIAKAPYSPQEIARFEVPDPDVINFDPDNRSHYRMYYLRVTPVGIARSQEMIALPEGGYDPEAIIYVSETPASLKVGVYPGTNIPFNLDRMIEMLSDSRPETVAEAIAHEIQNPVRPGKKAQPKTEDDDNKETQTDPDGTAQHGEERTGEIKMKIVSLLKSGLSVAQIVERMGKQVRSQAYQYAKDIKEGVL